MTTCGSLVSQNIFHVVSHLLSLCKVLFLHFSHVSHLPSSLHVPTLLTMSNKCFPRVYQGNCLLAKLMDLYTQNLFSPSES